MAILGLIASVSHSNGPIWAFSTWVLKENGVRMPLLGSSPSQVSLGEVLHENRSNLHFDPGVVTNIINGFARVGSPRVLVTPRRGPEERFKRTLWKKSTCERGMYMYRNVYVRT